MGVLHGVLAALKRSTPNPVDRGTVFVLGEIGRSGPVRPSELAELVGLDGSTVSRHVSHLVDQGYAERSPDPEDARAQRLRITESGQALLASAWADRAAALQHALAAWSDADKAKLVKLLRQLAEDLAPPPD